MQDLHINIHQVIHLWDGHDIEMLMNEEQFHLMVSGSVSDAVYYDIHNLVADIEGLQISQVDVHSYLESVIR